MVFQLTRYLAKKGLDPIDEGEAQTLKRYIHEDQREQSLKWIKKLMIKHRKAFEAAEDELYGKCTGGNNALKHWRPTMEQLAKVSPSDGWCEEALQVQARDYSTARDKAISKVH